MSPRIILHELRWSRGERPLLHVPHVELPGPGLVLLLGGTGSGKTSLLKALTGTLAEFHGGHVSGRVEFASTDGAPLPRIGYVPQNPEDGLLGFDARSEFELRLQSAGRNRADAVLEASRLLEELHYHEKERIPFAQLSGGERQRLALRAAQVHHPSILLLDEPLNHLDATWRGELLNEILETSERVLVVAATHDPDPWLPEAARILLLRQGRIAWDGGPAQFETQRGLFPELRTPDEPSIRGVVEGRGPAIVAAERLDGPPYAPLFKDLHAEFRIGLHAIVGPNGSGKSTLLRILAGLESISTGSVRIEETPLADFSPAQRSRTVAFQFPEPGQYFFELQSQRELEFQPRNAGLPPGAISARVTVTVARFRLGDLMVRHPATLSGGEQTRLALACLDAAAPRVLMLDEPSQGLDGPGWADLRAFLDRMRRNACVIIATHDPALVRMADTVHRIAERQLEELHDGPEMPRREGDQRTPD